MKSCLKDSLFKKVFKNAVTLGSGKLLGSFAVWAALLCETHALSVHDYGIFVIATSYITTVRAVVRFQSWQLVLHYAAVPWLEGQKERVIDTIKFAYGLDYITGLVGMVVAMLGVIFFSPLIGLDGEVRNIILLACTVLPLSCGTTDIGILRLLDRVKMLASKDIVTPLFRLGTALVAWSWGGNITSFILAWYATSILEECYSLFLGWRALRKEGITEAIRPSLIKASKSAPAGIWGFICTSSLNVLLFSCWKPVSNLIVGATLGSSVAGVYDLASRLVTALASPAGLLEKNCYPEVVRMNTRDKEPWVFTFRFCVLSGLIGLAGMALIYGGGYRAIALFGEKYLVSAGVLMWMAPGLFFDTVTRPLDGILFTSGNEKRLMGLEAVGCISYLLMLLAVTGVWGEWLGINGAGLAYAVARTLLGSLMIMLTLYVYWNKEKIVAPHERV